MLIWAGHCTSNNSGKSQISRCGASNSFQHFFLRVYNHCCLLGVSSVYFNYALFLSMVSFSGLAKAENLDYFLVIDILGKFRLQIRWRGKLLQCSNHFRCRDICSCVCYDTHCLWLVDDSFSLKHYLKDVMRWEGNAFSGKSPTLAGHHF